MDHRLIAVLSKVVSDALDWFVKYHNSHHWSDERHSWKPEYSQQLKPYRLKKPTKLYRALSWPNYEDYQEYDYGFPLKDKSNFVLPKLDLTPYSSWTKSLDYAKSFVSLDPFGFVVEATIQPSASILDFDNLPDSVKSKLRYGDDEEEVLVTEKDRTVKLVYMYDEYGDIKP